MGPASPFWHCVTPSQTLSSARRKAVLHTWGALADASSSQCGQVLEPAQSAETQRFPPLPKNRWPGVRKQIRSTWKMKLYCTKKKKRSRSRIFILVRCMKFSVNMFHSRIVLTNAQRMMPVGWKFVPVSLMTEISTICSEQKSSQ